MKPKLKAPRGNEPRGAKDRDETKEPNMLNLAISNDPASTPIEITVYRGAKKPDPIARDTLTWAALGDEIEALVAEPAPSKDAMHAIGPYRLREGTTRAGANVDRMSAVIALDV